MSDAPVERRLSELAERTRALGPRPGFQARVLETLAARARSTLRAEVWRSARFFVPAAFALAAVAVGLAAGAQEPSSVDIAAAELSWERDF
ncbi:MAG TPA: hypothetical protein VFZ53_30210 [Polyangiaceae bacterium]